MRLYRDQFSSRLIAKNKVVPSSVGFSLFGWVTHLDSLVLFLFTAASMTLDGPGQLRILAILLGYVVLIVRGKQLLRAGKFLTPIPRDLIFYTLWALWAGVTGFFVSVDLDRFQAAYLTLAQVVLLMWITYVILRVQKDAVYSVYFGVILGALIQISNLLLTRGFDLLTPSLVRVSGFGVAANPNSLGILMVWASLCAIMIWHSSRRISKWIGFGILSLIPLFGYFIVISGSRKAFLAFALLIILWVLFSQFSQRSFTNWVMWLIIGSLLVLAPYYFFPDWWEQTILANRVAQFLDASGGKIVYAVQQNERYELYTAGLHIWQQSPIWGVGLNHFGRYFRVDVSSHSNYLEALVSTGVVGFLVLHTAYLIVIWRTLMLTGKLRGGSKRYQLNVILIGIVLILQYGLGAAMFTNIAVSILLISFSVHTLHLSAYN
jgi:O-antigen ligase